MPDFSQEPFICWGIDPSFTSSGLVKVAYDPTRPEPPQYLDAWKITTAADSGPDLERINFIIHSVASLMDPEDKVLAFEAPFAGKFMSPMLFQLFISLIQFCQMTHRLGLVFTPKQNQHFVVAARGKERASVKTAMKQQFRDECQIKGPFVNDIADAYFLAKHGARLATLWDQDEPQSSNPGERHIFLNKKLNSKKTAPVGMLYRPWESVFDYRNGNQYPNPQNMNLVRLGEKVARKTK